MVTSELGFCTERRGWDDGKQVVIRQEIMGLKKLGWGINWMREKEAVLGEHCVTKPEWSPRLSCDLLTSFKMSRE